MDPHRIIRRALVTEKGTALREQNKYVFEVDRQANKIEIKRAIEALFGVTVTAVHA
ncbi:MAG: 50S ribosomal protein L23, partial [candidate division NC10 bacterium]